MHFEGLRLSAYLCPAGKWTIGYGSTFWPDGRPVKLGDRLANEAEARALLDATLRPFEQSVAALVKAATPAQFGALVSFAFNTGINSLRRSTLLRLHNAGDTIGAEKQFGKWTRSRGRVLPGLVQRRKAEAALYRGDFETFDRITQYQP